MPLSTTIAAGKLRHSIDICEQNARSDSFGGNAGKVSDVSVVFEGVRASIETYTGREVYSAEQVVSQVTHVITMRWLPGITSAMSVRWSDDGLYKFFQIQDVRNPDGRHKMLVLMCIERDDSQRAE